MSKKLNIKPIAITIIVVGFLFFIKIQFPHYQVSSNSMKPSLITGDIVLVNKLINDNSIKNNDICVFELNNEQQISRIVGLPGDEVEIVNGTLLVNGIEQSDIITLSTYKIFLSNHPPLAEYDLMLLLQPINQFEEYTANLTEQQAKKINQLEFVKSITKIIHPKKYHYSFSKNPIFPNRNSFNWSRDNFGPIIIPKKGDKLKHNNYTLKNNYYFVMGDNRSQSLDSRYFGFVSENNIIGKLILTLYSNK